MHWSFEKYWFTDMWIFQLLHISLYNIKKKKWSLLLPLRSSEKSLRIRKLWSLQCQRQVFQNSDFHLKAQILFTTGQKYSQLFSLRWQVLCLFSRKHPSLNNQSACKPFFLEKMAFPEKSSYFNSQLHCTSTCPETQDASRGSTRASCTLPTSSHRILKRPGLQAGL